MAEHKLKCWSTYFDAVASGDKTFEVRYDDRGYQKGDVLVLQKFDQKHNCYELAGSRFSDPIQVRKRVTWILTGGHFGIEAGYVVMGLGPDPTSHV